MTEKYFPNKLVLSGEYKQGDSYIWKEIVTEKNGIKKGFRSLLGDRSCSLWYDDWMGSKKSCYRVPFVHISDTLLTVVDIWKHGTWYFQELYTPLPSSIRTKICLISVPSNPDGSDTPQGSHTIDGVFSSQSAYAFLAGEGTASHNPCWKQIWRTKVPERIRFFLWQIAREVIPTNSKQRHNHLAVSSVCPRCDGDVEDVDHLFRCCDESRQLWQLFRHSLPFLANHEPFQVWFRKLIASKDNVSVVAVLWWSWRWRNNRVFGDNHWHISYVSQQVMADIMSWQRWPGVGDSLFSSQVSQRP